MGVGGSAERRRRGVWVNARGAPKARHKVARGKREARRPWIN